MARNLPFKSLDAATSIGAGTARDLEETFSFHTMLLVITGDPASYNVFLDGSHDGTNWFQLGSTTTDTKVRATLEVRYVRATLGALSGGTAPTVTATIGSA